MKKIYLVAGVGGFRKFSEALRVARANRAQVSEKSRPWIGLDFGSGSAVAFPERWFRLVDDREWESPHHG